MITSIRSKLPADVQWFDILATEGTSTSISFKNNRLHSLNEKQNSGLGLRVNREGKTGFSYTNDPGGFHGVVDRALALAPFGEMEGFALPAGPVNVREPFDPAIETFRCSDEIERGLSVMKDILREYPHANIDLGMGKSLGRTRIENSSGFDSEYRNSFYSLSVSVTVIQEDGTKIDVWESLSALAPCPVDDMAPKLIRKIALAEKVRKAASGAMPVVLTPRAFSRLLGIMASGLDAKSVYRGISPFAGKTGERLFHESFTLADDPSLVSSPYSYPFDDEGVAARHKYLVRRGVIENFVTDLKHAEKLGLTPTGNASRGYASLPSPSFSNIVIEGGNTGIDDILKNLDRGIMVEQFIGLGQSNTLTGDFSANLDLAYLVEKGEITGRVKDCMLADNIFSLLDGEVLFSSEREHHGSVLAPWAFFPSVNFTGQDR